MNDRIVIKKYPPEIEQHLDTIYDLLIRKAYTYGRKCDFSNQTYIKGIGFWLQYDEASKNTFICFSKRPEFWGDLAEFSGHINVLKEQLDNLVYSSRSTFF
jgi:hypothetical protein